MIGEAVARRADAARPAALSIVELAGATVRRGRSWIWLPPLLLAATAVIALLLTGFDGLYGQDSFAYFRYATGPLRQHLFPLPAFFWPPGYPLLLAMASTIIGAIPLAGQVVSVIAGAAVPAFTALLATELVRPGERPRNQEVIRRPPVPLLAGLIAALTGQLLQSSIVVMADTLGLATATAGAWAMARYHRGARPGWLMLAAAAFAWAITTRWIYGLVALPFVVWAIAVLARRPAPIAWRHAVGPAVVGGAILAPTLAPALLGLFHGANAPFAGDLQVYSWSPLNAIHSDFMTGDGQLSYSLPNGLYYALLPGFWWYMGPVLAALVVQGIWAVLRRRERLPAFILLGWLGIVYAFHAGAPWQNPRFALAYLPPIAILGSLGFSELYQLAHQPMRAALTFVLIGGLALAAAGSLVLTDRFIARKQGDTATVQWTERLAPHRAQLLTFGLTATFQQYSPVPTFDLSEVDSATINRLVSDGRPTLVLVDVTDVEQQWKGRPVWTNFHRMGDSSQLVRLGVRGGYTLFAVGQGSS